MALPSDAAHGCRDVSRSGGGMKTMNDTLGILVMNNQLKKKFLAATIATVGVMPVLAYAQTHAGPAGHTAAPRTDELRVGKQCVSKCRSRWSPSYLKTNKN